MKIDMHNHTDASPDALTTKRELIKRAKAKGIDAIAITDHNTMRAVKELQKIGKEQGIYVIPGEEITTKQGDLIGLFLFDEIRPYMDFYETIDEIKSQGAIAYAPHPFDFMRHGINKKELLKECNIIEVYNAKSPEQADKEALLFADENNIIKGAGSDSHSPFEVGRAYVFVDDNIQINTPEKLLMALRKGMPVLEQRTSILDKVIKKAYISLKKFIKK
ncbi:MAG: PHP domain-containing protein [Candidatus Anstonellales archaeon]